MPTITRCLSLLEPWAWAVTSGFKLVENRTWPTGYRGRVAIHASKSMRLLNPPLAAGSTAGMSRQNAGLDELDELHEHLCGLHPGVAAALDDPRITRDSPLFQPGCIVGSVEIVDCVPLGELGRVVPRLLLKYAEAAAIGPLCWVLRGARRYARPIPCRGKLSLWKLGCTAGVSGELERAVAAAEAGRLLKDAGEPAKPPWEGRARERVNA